jgi:hypothetical protein
VKIAGSIARAILLFFSASGLFAAENLDDYLTQSAASQQKTVLFKAVKELLTQKASSLASDGNANALSAVIYDYIENHPERKKFSWINLSINAKRLFFKFMLKDNPSVTIVDFGPIDEVIRRVTSPGGGGGVSYGGGSAVKKPEVSLPRMNMRAGGSGGPARGGAGPSSFTAPPQVANTRAMNEAKEVRRPNAFTGSALNPNSIAEPATKTLPKTRPIPVSNSARRELPSGGAVKTGREISAEPMVVGQGLKTATVPTPAPFATPIDNLRPPSAPSSQLNNNASNRAITSNAVTAQPATAARNSPFASPVVAAPGVLQTAKNFQPDARESPMADQSIGASKPEPNIGEKVADGTIAASTEHLVDAVADRGRRPTPNYGDLGAFDMSSDSSGDNFFDRMKWWLLFIVASGLLYSALVISRQSTQNLD